MDEPRWIEERPSSDSFLGAVSRRPRPLRVAPGQPLTVDELCQVLYRFLAPPWDGCGVSTSTSMLKFRSDRGFDEAGALWFSAGNRRVFSGIGVPLGTIPWRGWWKGGWFDDRQQKWVGRAPRKGWRAILGQAREKGFLRRDDPELLRLLHVPRGAIIVGG